VHQRAGRPARSACAANSRRAWTGSAVGGLEADDMGDFYRTSRDTRLPGGPIPVPTQRA
jgi:hypothetical protein